MIALPAFPAVPISISRFRANGIDLTIRAVGPTSTALTNLQKSTDDLQRRSAQLTADNQRLTTQATGGEAAQRQLADARAAAEKLRQDNLALAARAEQLGAENRRRGAALTSVRALVTLTRDYRRTARAHLH